MGSAGTFMDAKKPNRRLNCSGANYLYEKHIGRVRNEDRDALPFFECAVVAHPLGETTVDDPREEVQSRTTQRGNIMIPLVASIKRFLVSEDGPTAVEYAVMLALIIVVCLTAIQAVGTNASTTFTNVSTQLGGS
jgi:pilus assembly protein Flp/PilA